MIGSILLVFVVTLVVTVVIVTFYALGLRLLSVRRPSTAGSALPGDDSEGVRPVGATLGAVACIAIGAAAVLYGAYLVIPLFH